MGGPAFSWAILDYCHTARSPERSLVCGIGADRRETVEQRSSCDDAVERIESDIDAELEPSGAAVQDLITESRHLFDPGADTMRPGDGRRPLS
jgi:hypothetical protein